MNTLPPPNAVAEIDGDVTSDVFASLRQTAQPVIIRGLVAGWPVVKAALSSDEALVEYLSSRGSPRPVTAIAAPPRVEGRFFYSKDMRGLNFTSGQGPLEAFLSDLLTARELSDPPALAVQSEDIGELLPHVANDNRLSLLPDVRPRIWIGNRIRVAPHYDIKENVACCVAGRRRFTLFPPDQIANLYPGPFELTPAGTPVSMVDPADPDLLKYPRFVDAWQHAVQGTLEPGDAIYVPYCWWHGVDSLEPLSILVNYWWNEGEPEGIGSPYEALLHALYALRHLPPGRRAVWKAMMDYYVFEESGDPVEHLPAHVRGMMGSHSPAMFAHMREIMRGIFR